VAVEEGWQRRHPHVQLDRAAMRSLLAVAVLESEVLGGGLRNTNYKLRLAGNEPPMVLSLGAPRQTRAGPALYLSTAAGGTSAPRDRRIALVVSGVTWPRTSLTSEKLRKWPMDRVGSTQGCSRPMIPAALRRQKMAVTRERHGTAASAPASAEVETAARRDDMAVSPDHEYADLRNACAAKDEWTS
jgi:hypothetical protein